LYAARCRGATDARRQVVESSSGDVLRRTIEAAKSWLRTVRHLRKKLLPNPTLEGRPKLVRRNERCLNAEDPPRQSVAWDVVRRPIEVTGLREVVAIDRKIQAELLGTIQSSIHIG
jgi:hypothetical protein